VTVSRNRLLVVLGVLVVVLGVVVAVGLGDEDLSDESTSGPSTSTTGTTAPTTTASSTSTTAVPAPLPSTTSAPSSDPSPLPAVTITEARPGGGSGEVQLSWAAVDGATGYRVERVGGAGSFVVIVDVDVVTGAVSVLPEVANVFSTTHTYRAGGQLDAPDPSPTFSVVHVAGPGERCFRVRAYDGDGEGPPSPVACASPP
jgi:hypothetical protein